MGGSLLAIVDKLAKIAQDYEVDLFLFGSILTSPHPSDVDVLCISDSLEKIRRVRAIVSADLSEWVIDFIAMTRREEAELDFIANVGAVLIAGSDPGDLPNLG